MLPQLITRRGAMVFMASVQSLASQRNVAAYTAAKHGLICLSRSIAMDFAAQGVNALLVFQGSYAQSGPNIMLTAAVLASLPTLLLFLLLRRQFMPGLRVS